MFGSKIIKFQFYDARFTPSYSDHVRSGEKVSCSLTKIGFRNRALVSMELAVTLLLVHQRVSLG
jgi:hypothetical protein